MQDIVLRGIPDEELEALDARARRRGRTRELELRHMIHDAAREERALGLLERATDVLEERLERVAPELERHGGRRGRRGYRLRRVEPTPHRDAAGREVED